MIEPSIGNRETRIGPRWGRCRDLIERPGLAEGTTGVLSRGYQSAL